MAIAKSRAVQEKTSAYWTDCGLPQSLSNYLADLACNAIRKKHHALERARRFRLYWEKNPDDEKPGKHWRKLEAAAGSTDGSRDEALIAMFLAWPDTAMRQPYAHLYGERKKGRLVLTVEDERENYRGLADSAKKLSDFLRPGQEPNHFENPTGDARKSDADALTEGTEFTVKLDFFGSGQEQKHFKNLLRDAQASGGDAQTAAIEFMAKMGNFRESLLQLERVLRLVDPAAKYPTGQPGEKSEGKSSYIAALAALNQYLEKSKCTAIAYLAAINNPDVPVKATAITKARIRQ
jgi:hypothetical protein